LTKESAQTIQISRKGMIIWIGLIIFISFWMFVLGVLVGRGTAPVNLEAGKLEKELAELKARMFTQEQEKMEARQSGKQGDKPELEFYEALKNPGKEAPFKPLKPLAPMPNKPLVAPEPPAPRPARPETAKARPAAPVAETAPKPKPAAKTASTKPATPSAPAKNHFSVQVASVQESRGAEKLVAELRKKGYQAYQIRSEVAGKGVWYRIRVGAFEERAAAAKMLARLKGDKYTGMVVSTR
jgi:DedD protein